MSEPSGKSQGDAPPQELIDLSNEKPNAGTLKDVAKKRKPRGTLDQETRRTLAFWILGVLGTIYVGIFACYLAGVIDSTGLTTAIAAVSGPQALGAAAAGFYFGTERRDEG